MKFVNAQATLISGVFKLQKELVVEKVNKVIVPKEAINELKHTVVRSEWCSILNH